jgi:hypothetical protein
LREQLLANAEQGGAEGGLIAQCVEHPPAQTGVAPPGEFQKTGQIAHHMTRRRKEAGQHMDVAATIGHQRIDGGAEVGLQVLQVSGARRLAGMPEVLRQGFEQRAPLRVARTVRQQNEASHR